MSYQAIDAHREIGAVTTLCRALNVAVSGYYAWRGRGPSEHQQRDAELLEHIRVVQKQGRDLYGSDRIYHVLRKRIARLMGENGLNSRRRRCWRPRTTDRSRRTCSAAISARMPPTRNGSATSLASGRMRVGCIWRRCWMCSRA
jgi:hypothetical protein